MNDPKTMPTAKSVKSFLESVEPEKQREQAKEIYQIMKEVTGKEGKMWGEAIVGFDEYHYKYKSGQEGDWLAVGFSPRKGKISLYLTYSLEEYMKDYDSLSKLKHGKVCLYVKDLDDLDKQELKKLIERSYKEIKETNHIAE